MSIQPLMKPQKTYRMLDENRHSLFQHQPIGIFPNSVFISLLSACGGGSGGGGGLNIIAPELSALPNSELENPIDFVRLPNGTYAADIQEGRTFIDTLSQDFERAKEVNSIFNNITIKSVTVINDHIVDVILEGNGRSLPLRYVISGPDAEVIKFVQNGPRDYGVIAKQPVDYEAPDDHNQDNVYEITYTASTNSIFVQSSQRTIITKYKLQITNNDGDVASVVNPQETNRQGPEYSRSSDDIALRIDEGQTIIFEIKNIVLTGTVSLQEGLLQNALTGADASDVQIRQTATRQDTFNRRTARDLIVEFSSAPNFDRPADANSDNLYEFALDGVLAAAFGNLDFDVTVVDVV